jgi:lipopolysaccharide export system ATP-binding protein
MKPRILEVERLVKSYGRRRVVDGVSFEVSEGEIIGLLGPNGAGKTTSFRMTCGMVDPDRGTVRLNGIDVTRWPMYRRARDGGMGYLAQESSVFRKLTVEQNLLSVMELLGMKAAERKERCEQLLTQFYITHIRRSRAAMLSGGERRRLEIARCLISNPSIILLDEPFAGIDPVTVQSIQGIIRELSSRGIAVLITDHAAREILQIVDRCYVISEGKVLCEGEPDQIKQNEEVRKKYLGDLDSSRPIPIASPVSATVAESVVTSSPSTSSASLRDKHATVGSTTSGATPAAGTRLESDRTHREPASSGTSSTREASKGPGRGRTEARPVGRPHGFRFSSIHEDEKLDANE